jgi:transposase
VLHPASVPVDRRARRAKTDRLDVDLLLRAVLAWLRDEPGVCSMAPVPDEADEDQRRAMRERQELLTERVRLTNRVGNGTGRLRRVLITALARKLLIALWRFARHGIMPEGAVLTTA